MKKEASYPINSLNLEVEILEKKPRPGCQSSSTSPLCTCPIYLQPFDPED